MLIDTWTVLRKELGEVLRLYAGGRLGLVGLLVMPLVLGVFLPLQTGREWVDSPIALVIYIWLPLFLVLTVVADSFAGERERHTLETLLATRLPDAAILLGKVGAAMAYGWGVTMLAFLVSLVTVNLAYGGGELLFYAGVVTSGVVGLSFLVAGLSATAGVLLSLRAATVRQVQQGMGIAILLITFLPSIAIQLLPRPWLMRVARWVLAADLGALALGAAGVLVLLDLALLAAALARFRRSRLIGG